VSPLSPSPPPSLSLSLCRFTLHIVCRGGIASARARALQFSNGLIGLRSAFPRFEKREKKREEENDVQSRLVRESEKSSHLGYKLGSRCT